MKDDTVYSWEQTKTNKYKDTYVATDSKSENDNSVVDSQEKKLDTDYSCKKVKNEKYDSEIKHIAWNSVLYHD